MADRDWTFCGRVADVTRKELKGGKTLHTLAIYRQDGKYERICVCDYWRDLPDGVEVGSDVEAGGRMNGRVWNNRHYAGLTAEEVVLRGAVTTDETPPHDLGIPSSDSVPRREDADDGADDNLPF